MQSKKQNLHLVKAQSTTPTSTETTKPLVPNKLGYARGETHKITQPTHGSRIWIARFHAALSMASSLVILIQKYIISYTQKYTYHAKTVEVIQSATILTIKV
jgi:hypothetical protein